MDQVKVYLGVAKKHHFWILSAIVVITAITVWMKASSSLKAKYESDKKKIVDAEAAAQKANAPGPDGYLPNQQFATKVDSLHDGLKTQVFDAWQKLYQRQVALFKWPDLEELGQGVDLNKLKPDEEIPEFVRDFYNQQKVREQWEAVLEEAQIRRPKVENNGDDDGEADEAEADEEKRGVEYQGLVVWKPELREAIVSRYYSAKGPPSTARLRLAQEDVWLFESLIEVVNTVNAGATDSLKAPIKEIESLDVAQWAVVASLESGTPIHIPGKAPAGAAAGGGTMGSGPMGMSGSGGMPSMGGGPAGGGGGMPSMGGGAPASGGAPAGPGGGGGGPAGAPPASASGGASASAGEGDNEWLDGRYLDEKGQPLKAGSAQPFAEFRQVFVYMKFIMDQRRISDLIAACANAQLPIETRQVKVQMLKTDTAAGGGGLFPQGGMQGGMFGGMSSGAMNGPMGSGGGPMGSGGGPMGGPEMSSGMGMATSGPSVSGGGMGLGGQFGGQEGGVETTVFDAIVELSGVVYLYNPPDVAKLGTGAAGAPEKRSFGVPTTAVRAPGGSAVGRSSFGAMTGQ